MAFDYAALRDGTVEPLIANFGDEALLKTPSDDRENPYDSQLNADGECEIEIKFVRIQFTKEDNNGTLVEKGDQLLLVSTENVSIDPELPYTAVLDCKQYQVVRIDPLKPGPTTMLWKVHVRK